MNTKEKSRKISKKPHHTPIFMKANSQKRTQGLPRLTKNFKPDGPDMMGPCPTGLDIFKPEGSFKERQAIVNKIFKKALAAKQKAGK